MNNFTPSSDDRETPPVASSHDEAPTQTTRDGCGVDSAGGELFAIPETKSPRLKWMERHHIKIHHQPYDHAGPLDDDEQYAAIHGMQAIGYGATPDAALVAAAKSLNIKLWNE
jgi:hypothetical protein